MENILTHIFQNVLSYKYEITKGLDMLTENEAKLLQSLIVSDNNIDAAKSLNLNVEEYKKQLKKLYKKMGVFNRVQAIILYLKNS